MNRAERRRDERQKGAPAELANLNTMQEGDLRIMLCANPDHPFHVWTARPVTDGGPVEFRPASDDDPIAAAIISAATEHIQPLLDEGQRRLDAEREEEELSEVEDGVAEASED